MSAQYQFAICVQNEGYPASLELWKVYRVLPDKNAAQHQLIRVIDESGEDYLYDENSFVKIELPKAVEESISKRVVPPNGAHTSTSLPELNINSDEWIKTEGLPRALAKKINNSPAAIVFTAAGKENLLEPEPSALVGQLTRERFVVGWQNVRSFPGPPYFEALIALVPSGAVVLTFVRDLILAWLQGRREREIEILMPGKPSVRLKAVDATPRKAEALISALNRARTRRRTTTRRRTKKLTKRTSR
jgi:hypothetical protein